VNRAWGLLQEPHPLTDSRPGRGPGLAALSDPNHLADDGLVGRYEIERGRDAVSELKLSRGERSEMTGEDPTCMCLREG
jgi:hypothetical protein